MVFFLFYLCNICVKNTLGTQEIILSLVILRNLLSPLKFFSNYNSAPQETFHSFVILEVSIGNNKYTAYFSALRVLRCKAQETRASICLNDTESMQTVVSHLS